jgi:hypothetical protein
MPWPDKHAWQHFHLPPECPIPCRHLHSTCSLLIAFNALCTVLLLSAIFIPFFVVLLPQIPSVPILLCFFLQLLPNFGVFNVISTTCAIGVDRLLSVFFPLWYIRRDERLGLVAMAGLASTFSLFINWLIYQSAKEEPGRLLICTLGEMLGKSTPPVAGLCLLCNLLAVLCYSTIWAKLKWDIRRSLSTESKLEGIFLGIGSVHELLLC